jgi:hypothetical protein
LFLISKLSKHIFRPNTRKPKCGVRKWDYTQQSTVVKKSVREEKGFV